MNDKVKELIEKATVSYASHGAFGEYEESQVLEGELLVKLVVEECIKLCEAEREQYLELSAQNNGRQSDFAFGSVNSAEHIALSLREHFGVEK